MVLDMVKMLNMQQDFKLKWMLKRKMIKPVTMKKMSPTKGRDAKNVAKARKNSVKHNLHSNSSNSTNSKIMAQIGRKILNLLNRVSPESTSVGSSKRLSMTTTP